MSEIERCFYGKQDMKEWREQIEFGKQYKKGLKMSLDHKDIERIERIEKMYREFTEDINGLSHQLIDMRKAIITIEERLSMMDESKKEKIKDLDQQIDSMIGQLPVGFRGMMKKIVSKENRLSSAEDNQKHNGDEKNA